MRTSIIFGPNSSERDFKAFQTGVDVSWLVGMPEPSDDIDALVLFGGDGTLHMHLPHLLELKKPVLIVPRGSGNDFARALGVRGWNHSQAAWRKFVSGAGNIRAVDVGVIKAVDPESREYYFCTVAGVGLDGEIARRANRLPRWLRGNGGYALMLVPAVFRSGSFMARIMQFKDIDTSLADEFQPTMLASFANVPAYGGGMKIAPEAKIDDGQIDICLIRDINKLKLFCLFPTIYFGRHLGIAEVEYSQVPKVRLETIRPLDVYADGEYVCRTPIEVSLKAGALRVIVPEVHL